MVSLQLSLVLPAYNEEESLFATLEETFAFLTATFPQGNYEVIVVDDGSTDQTYEQAQGLCSQHPQLRLLQHSHNRGMGAALRTGFAAARGVWVTLLPADGQIAPQQLAPLLQLRSPDTPLITTCFPHRFRTADSSLRWILSRSLKALTRFLLGLTRELDGLYLIRNDLLQKLLPLVEADSFVANIEIPLRALRLYPDAPQLPLEVRPRQAGSSKILSLSNIARVFNEILLLRARLP